MVGENSIKKIITKLRILKPILREKYHVDEIMIFGSYVEGREKDSSDLDILVEFTQKKSFLD